MQAERQAPRLRPPGTGPAGTIEFADHGLRDSGAHQPDIRQAWIVIPAITNPGLTPVRSEDLTTPLTCTFHGRQVHTAQVRAGPQTRRGCQVPAPHATTSSPGQPSDKAAIQLQAGFRLNRHEELIQNVGTPLPPLKTRSARKAR